MRIVPAGTWLWWITVMIAAGYGLVALFVVVGRIRFDRRHRLLERVEALLLAREDHESDAARRRQALDILHRSPLATVERLASESTVSPAVQRALAESLLDRIGLDTLRRRADARGQRRQRWRRIAALRNLALASPAEAWDYLARALAGEPGDVADATIVLLGQLPDRRAAVLLADALRQGRHLRSRIATALDTFRMDIPDVIAPLLDSAESRVRYWGCLLMRRYPAHAEIEQQLHALTHDTSPFVRKAAVGTLAMIPGPLAVSAAKRLLDDPVPYVRAHAARALGVLGAREAVTAILPLFADRNWWVRFAAKQSVEAMSADVWEQIVPYLSHPDEFARNGAAEVLQHLGAFERLLAREAAGPADPARVRILELLARAGGVRMWDSVLLRLSPREQDRARELLAHVQLAEESRRAVGV